LNALLAAGGIDVAPCSSIEYARHQSDYRLLPGLAIASYGPVQSILLESVAPAEELGGCDVLVPTASATSVVLLRILLELRLGVRANLLWFDQSLAQDPLSGGAAAALWIGDVALRRDPPAGRRMTDLGEAWTDWTRLPFAYALWQARADTDPAGLASLHAVLLESRAFFAANIDALAQRHAPRFEIDAVRLGRYWRSLCYDLDDDTRRGLLHFYRLAAALGEAPPVTALQFIDTAPA
jgi:chorismate dehydratase